jgi:hypothetical protein
LKVLRKRPYFLGLENDPKIVLENERKSGFRPKTGGTRTPSLVSMTSPARRTHEYVTRRRDGRFDQAFR